ncbi:DUF5709 domain-containing protein [Gordonia sinesedis]
MRPGIVSVVKDDIGSTPEGSDGEYSLDDDDQLQPEDTLADRGVVDILDEGFSPPDYAPKGAVHGLTAQEMREGETLDQRLAEEVPDVGAADPLDEIEADERRDWQSHESDRVSEFEEADSYDSSEQATDLDETTSYVDTLDDDTSAENDGDAGQVGARRAGRLIAPDEGFGPDTESDAVATDCGIDGAGASAEEAAVHYVDDEPSDDFQPAEDIRRAEEQW